MTSGAVGLPALIVSTMLACSSPASPDSVADDAALPAAAPSEIATAVVDATNVERARAGLSALRANARLMEAAQIHADQMARLRRLDHILADGTYPRPEDRLAAASYRWQAWAENVAAGQRTAAEVVAGWMRSPGHRANILNATYTEMGAGYARDADGRPYWVQVFGLPLS